MDESNILAAVEAMPMLIGQLVLSCQFPVTIEATVSQLYLEGVEIFGIFGPCYNLMR